MTAPVADRRIKPLPMVAAWFAARHAQDQETIADNLVLGLFPLWQIMRFRELDASTTLWLPAVLPRVETTFLQSQRLSAVFNANVRAAELPVDVPIAIDLPNVEFPLNISVDSFRAPPGVDADPVIDRVAPTVRPAGSGTPPAVQQAGSVVSDVLDAESQRVAQQIAHGKSIGTPQWILDQIQRQDDIRTGRQPQQRIELDKFDRADVAKTLTIEANYKTKRAMPGPEEQLMHDALVRSSGAAVRESLNGARGVTNLMVKKDRKIIGFARVTDSDPCALCALLASRGAVYGKGAFIKSDKKFQPNPNVSRDQPEGWTDIAKVHDNCRCMMRPVYAKKNSWDDGAKHYLNLWGDVSVSDADLERARRKHPTYGPRKLRHAAQMEQYRKLVKDNPFAGNQFDLNQMRSDVEDRMAGLLDAGFSPDSPQVQWHERTAALLR